ncbi:thioredoxin family protein [Xanthomonas sp. NCPPB 1325]|uniref:thioredoxin family protein n=1 Tax=Xanthomonas sp. NCPPB 1325 TaxID=487529 RepID=UPI003556F9EE
MKKLPPGSRSFMLIGLASLLSALTACERSAPSAANLPHATDSQPAATKGIDWQEGDIQRALNEAKRAGKPILMYWGAIWCPPCNRLKATTFKDPGFIAQTQHFVAIHLDGDQEDAQTWADRFGVKGYPTIVLLRPDLSEITRLVGDNSTSQLTDSLRVASRSSTSTKQILAQALKSPSALHPSDWTLLSNYNWLQDDQLIEPKEAPGVLAALAKIAPNPALQRRFKLLEIVVAKQKPGTSKATYSLLQTVLSDPSEVRNNFNVLIAGAATLVSATTTDADERTALTRDFRRSLAKAYADPALPIADRLQTGYAEIELARLAQGMPTRPKMDGPPPPLPADVTMTIQQRVRWAVTEAKTDEERQSTIASAAGLLALVGDNKGSADLMQAELSRSKTPSYYMPFLGILAEQRGDSKAALSWFKKAYDSPGSQGTVVQRGMTYLDALVRINPNDNASIENLATRVINDLTQQSDGYLNDNHEHFEEVGASLKSWGKQSQITAAVLDRLRKKAQTSCTEKNKPSACANWLA